MKRTYFKYRIKKRKLIRKFFQFEADSLLELMNYTKSETIFNILMAYALQLEMIAYLIFSIKLK